MAEVAKLAFDHGVIALCTFISPFAADRAFARSLLPAAQFLEIYVKCDLEVAKRRDPKGLYARALRGEIPEFTGVSSPYEEPVQPELVVETDLQSAEAIVERNLGRALTAANFAFSLGKETDPLVFPLARFAGEGGKEPIMGVWAALCAAQTP